MEEEKNLSDQVTATDQKMFTQDEVNEIVKKRLERVKQKSKASDEESEAFAKRIADLEEREKDYTKRVQELEKREATYKRMECSDFLKAHNLNEKLLDLFPTEDPEAFKETVSNVAEAFGTSFKSPDFVSHENNVSIGKGFAPGYKHVPKKY